MGAKEKIDIVITAKNITQKAFSTIKSSVGGVLKSLLSLKTAFAGLAATIGAGALVKSAVGTSASFEQISGSLQTLTGDAEGAMSWIKDFAVTTPYQVEQIAESYKKLSAYGLDPQSYLGSLGDVASAMGKSLDQSVEMFADAMTGEFERLKEFGVRAKTEGDNVTFSWMQNGAQMQTTAAKTGEGISAALAQIFERYQGSMNEQSKTFNGIWSNIKDQWTQFQTKIMDAGVFEYLKNTMQEFLDKANELADNGTLDAWAKEISDFMISAFDKAKTSFNWLRENFVKFKPELIEFGNKLKDIFADLVYVIKMSAKAVQSVSSWWSDNRAPSRTMEMSEPGNYMDSAYDDGFTPESMMDGWNRSGGNVMPKESGGNTVVIQAMDSESFNDFMKRNGKTVVDYLADDAYYGGAMKGFAR